MRSVKKTLNEMKELNKKPLTESNDFDYEYEETETSEDILDKVNELKLMNETMINMNNEEAYFGDWISFGPPDGATMDDFKDIAKDEEYYEDVKQLFKHVYKHYHDDGLFTDDKAVIDFAHEKDKEYGLEPIENLKVNEELTEEVAPIDTSDWAVLTKDEYSPEDDVYEEKYKDEILAARKERGLVA